MTSYDMAIVQEWISARAGSEQVFEAMASAFPEADLYALSIEPGVDIQTGNRPIRTTILDNYLMRSRRGLTLPLMPAAWAALGKDRYDLVLTSHHAFAQTNRLARDARQLVYVHSPARYIWSPEIDTRGASTWLRPARSVMKGLDRRATRRVAAYAANSRTVAKRVRDFWGRDADVIYPPVRTQFFGASAVESRGNFVLGVGRWVGYKNLHIIIDAAERAGRPAKIAGRGPDRHRILAAAEQAKVPVEVIESPSNDELRRLYQSAACLVFPTVEDFGIVPVEAQAAGCPVVALAEGGALETVHDGVSGIMVPNVEPGTLVAAIEACADLAGSGPRNNAQKFAHSRFQESLLRWVARSQ